MKVNFTVNNPHNIPVTKQVVIDGQPVAASLEGFEVHLMSQDGMSGGLVLRSFGSQAAEARALFLKHPVVTVSIDPAPGVAAPVAA